VLFRSWFKTVTRETWDDNNFLPSDYAEHPVLGLRLWREAARPDLHVWVRYLCEFNAQDVTQEFAAPAVPTLLLEPGLEGLPTDPGNDYMLNYCHASWQRWRNGAPQFQVQTVHHARACPWIDQPEAVDEALASFLSSLE
jgi:pimeloyl-ACP methyl ester carboxylesterase